MFDPENHVIKLCVLGMEREGDGDPHRASDFFLQAWQAAVTDLEKLTAAHYVARHQPTLTDKLRWDQTALTYAQKINSDAIKEAYPSLHLNVAKGYEDLNDRHQALLHYSTAQHYLDKLPNNGYRAMMKHGINAGMKRLTDDRWCTTG